ncbi:MAG: universal stress protein [Nitrospirota bacterium]|nr:universal stress protein [Nitrospirota bacterium]
MKGYRKILIAVNGSKNVLAEGLKLAGDEQCWVTVVKVIPPNEGDLNLTGIKNIGDVLDSGGERAISEFQNIAKAERMLIKTRLEEGKTHEKIIEVAEEERCDLIILGAQKKRNRLLKIFGGNTIEKVIHNAPCPVLVVGA